MLCILIETTITSDALLASLIISLCLLALYLSLSTMISTILLSTGG